MTLELVGDPRDRADERETEVHLARGRQRSVDDVPRSLVAAHCVNSDPKHRCQVRS
jgi:hypothetical protein